MATVRVALSGRLRPSPLAATANYCPNQAGIVGQKASPPDWPDLHLPPAPDCGCELNLESSG